MSRSRRVRLRGRVPGSGSARPGPHGENTGSMPCETRAKDGLPVPTAARVVLRFLQRKDTELSTSLGAILRSSPFSRSLSDSFSTRHVLPSTCALVVMATQILVLASAALDADDLARDRSRLHRCWSRSRQLAAEARVNRADVSRIETGRLVPSADQKRRLAAAFNLDEKQADELLRPANWEEVRKLLTGG